MLASRHILACGRLAAAAAGRAVARLPAVAARAASTCVVRPLRDAAAQRRLAPVAAVAWPTGARRDMSAKPEYHEFQAETRQLLDIVTHSIYTDKEVFLRELISNASDAMEKLRHLQVIGEQITSPSLPLEIEIEADKANRTLIIRDRGIGMTRDDMINHLGTIARSGSKAFVKELKEKGAQSSAAEGIIGQFGVGFYSAFMIADTVEVYSTPAAPGKPSHRWVSNGTGSYELHPVELADLQKYKVDRGCTIVMRVRKDCEEFLEPERIKEIIKRYSSFVAFPIKLDGEVVNTVQALWLKDKSEVTNEQYEEFYRFIANTFDTPTYTLHFRTDAPLDLKVLFFFPGFHTEKFGMSRLEPGVNLYSRKVLIEAKSKGILPDWMRFVKGVVDSEDLPLSLSREKPQDSRLLNRINDVLTRKVLRFLEDMAKNDPEKYKNWFKEFGFFLKEGVCQDYKNQANIAKLLYFESSKSAPGELISLDDYIARCPPEQNEIYYLCAPSRELAEASPYFETFKRNNTEVFFLFNSLDDFVMSNLGKYNGRQLKTAESADLNLDKEQPQSTEQLSAEEAQDLCKWIQQSLESQVREVKITHRLKDSPAIVTDHASGALRRMLRFVEQQNTGESKPIPKQQFEINPAHPIIKYLNAARKTDEATAKKVAEQVFDNAMIAAGLLDDPRAMLPRLNGILESLLSTKFGGQQ